MSVCVKKKAGTGGHGAEIEHPYAAIVMVTVEMI